MKKLYYLIICLSLISNVIFTQTTQDYAVQTWAEVQSSSPQITIHWLTHTDATGYTIYRKSKDAASWGAAISNLGATISEYIDTDVIIDSLYEYKIVKSGTAAGYGYIISGIEVSAAHNKGTIILIVDNETSGDIGYEIQQLINDFIGEGWKVISHVVSISASASSIRDIIITDYNANPNNVNAVFCFGRVPVPYSGNIAPDGHSTHVGAWPADGYYGEMDGTWTDATVSNSTSEEIRNYNEPGDGKFDQGIFPSNVELQVGRVNLSNMSSFTTFETTLLINYLNKDHAFRHKEITSQHRAVIDDNFGAFGGEAFAASGWKSFGPLVNPSNVSSDDYQTSMSAAPYIWSYGCGAGHYTFCTGVVTTGEFAADSLQGIFSCLFGSKFGDWDSKNNLLRASLAQGSMLTNCWSGRPHWQFHHMGMGENIGYSAKLCMNNSSVYFTGSSARSVSIGLMGDPTLKMYIVAPPHNCNANLNGTNVSLGWESSNDSILGYYVYRSDKFNNNYTLLTPNYITDTNYSDTLVNTVDTAYYMIRAVKLESTPSGSFYNLSHINSV